MHENGPAETPEPVAKKRGLAALKETNPERVREIAASGGRSHPPEKRAFARNHDLAVSAGRKGGQANGLSPNRKGGNTRRTTT